METTPHSDPLISVVMPCHNAEAYVETAIESALQQTHAATEIVVVDDGSTDQSVAVIERLQQKAPERITLLTQPQSGPYPARNRGLKEARGEYIAFLDADDWWHPECLQRLLSALEENRADLAYCGWQNVGEQARSTEPYIPPAYEQEDPVRAFLKGCPWPIHAALTRRSIIEAVNGFSERRFSAMDYDLWIRILGHTQNMVRVPEVLAYYRWHGSGQISSNKWQQVLDAVQVRRDFVRLHTEMTTHIPDTELKELTEGPLLNEAYRAYWGRDLHNAAKLFRAAFRNSGWSARDLRYMLPALLPEPLFSRLVGMSDRNQEAAGK